MLTVELTPAQALPREWKRIWSELQSSRMEFSSPFFRPEWTGHAAALLPDIQVAVLQRDRRPVGFLPFQSCGGHGRPVADTLSDFDGMVTSESDWDPRAVLAACRLRTLRFRNWPTQAAGGLTPYCWDDSPSLYVDLSAGFDVYAESRSRKRHKLRHEMNRLMRRAKNQFGEVTTRWIGAGQGNQADQTRERAITSMLRWKREQLAQRGISNALQQDGVPDLLRRILERPSRKFSGFIAAMFFGDQLVATEYFLRSGNLLHAWIRSYDADLSHFAPGHLLFWQTLQEAASQGVTRIDWGKGDESFKHRFTSCHTLVRSGWLDASPIRRAARHAAYHVSQSVALNNAVLNKALLQTKTFLAMDKIEMRGAS